MSFYAKMYEMLDKIERSLESDRIEWKQSEHSDTTFILDLSKAIIHIDRRPSRSNEDLEEETYDYIMKIYSKKTGSVVEEFDDVSLSKGLKEENRFINNNVYIKMRDIYTKVRRKTLGADDLIVSILDDIGY